MTALEVARQTLGDQLRDPHFHGSDRLIWSLAMPVLAQNFLGMFVGWSNTILAGQILGGEVYMAAGIIAGYLLWLLECIFSLICMGSHAIIARLWGAHRPEEGLANLRKMVDQRLIDGRTAFVHA